MKLYITKNKILYIIKRIKKCYINKYIYNPK